MANKTNKKMIQMLSLSFQGLCAVSVFKDRCEIYFPTCKLMPKELPHHPAITIRACDVDVKGSTWKTDEIVVAPGGDVYGVWQARKARVEMKSSVPGAPAWDDSQSHVMNIGGLHTGQKATCSMKATQVTLFGAGVLHIERMDPSNLQLVGPSSKLPPATYAASINWFGPAQPLVITHKRTSRKIVFNSLVPVVRATLTSEAFDHNGLKHFECLYDLLPRVGKKARWRLQDAAGAWTRLRSSLGQTRQSRFPQPDGSTIDCVPPNQI